MIGFFQARKGWESQASVERDKAVRGERVLRYGRLVETAGGMLAKSAHAAAEGGDHVDAAVQAAGPWASALLECQLVAAPNVRQIALELEILRKDRLDSTADPQTLGRLLTESDARLAALVEACRTDIANPQF